MTTEVLLSLDILVKGVDFVGRVIVRETLDGMFVVGGRGDDDEITEPAEIVVSIVLVVVVVVTCNGGLGDRVEGSVGWMCFLSCAQPNIQLLVSHSWLLWE